MRSPFTLGTHRAAAVLGAAALLLAACQPAAPSQPASSAKPTEAPKTSAAPTAPPTAAPAAKPAEKAPEKPADKPAAAAPTTVRQLTWLFPNNTVSSGYYAFYVAKDLGFWREEGLEVDFKTSGGSGAAIQQMIAGQVDGGVPSTPATMQALSRGQGLRSFYQYSTGTLFYLKVARDSPIQSVRDLKDKTIGISEAGGGEVPLIKAAVKGVGLDPEQDVRLIPIGEGSPSTFEAIKGGRVDAYASNFQDTLSIELAGLPLRDITPKEFDAFPAQAMVTTPAKLQEHHEAWVIMARGVARATHWCQNKKEQCVALVRNVAKEQWSDPRVGQAQLDRALEMTAVPQGQRFGAPDRENLEQYLTFLAESDPEFSPPNLDTFVVTDMLDEVNRFDREAVLKVDYKP